MLMVQSMKENEKETNKKVLANSHKVMVQSTKEIFRVENTMEKER